MKGQTRSPAIRRAVKKAHAIGWNVEFHDWCEDAETPGMLGHYAGVCVHHRKTIKVRTYGMTKTQMAAIIEHELEHAGGAEWGADHSELGLTCGGTIRPGIIPET